MAMAALELAPPAPAPVAVVSPQLCAPRTVPLTVTKMALSFSGGDFTITGADGALVLRVEGVPFSVGSRRVLHDAAGRPILTMQLKAFSMRLKWKVFRGDSTRSRDLLFTVKRTSLFQVKTSLGVFLARNTSEQVCDFKIKGRSYFERSCDIYLGNSNTMVAQMERKFTLSNALLGKNTYYVTVFPNVDHVFIVALAVILDDFQRDRSK